MRRKTNTEIKNERSLNDEAEVEVRIAKRKKNTKTSTGIMGKIDIEKRKKFRCEDNFTSQCYDSWTGNLDCFTIVNVNDLENLFHLFLLLSFVNYKNKRRSIFYL